MCYKTFVKVMMFVLNGIMFLAGIIILALGIWVAVHRVSLLGILESTEDATPELAELASFSYALIGVGAFLMLVTFIGCCGAIHESKCMLLSFFIIVLIIFLMEVAVAIVLVTYQSLRLMVNFKKVLYEMRHKVVKRIKDNFGEDESFTSVWQSAMTELKCCGYINYTDFTGSPFESTTTLYPDACCSSSLGCCTETAANNESVVGCFQALVNLIKYNAVVLAGVAFGVAALEATAMVVSIILYKNVGRGDQD